MIYEPREDTYLILEHLESRDLSGLRCLDMGTGSGILAEKMKDKGGEVVASDINPEASLNEVEFVESDLFDSINRKFDLIVFNPPYLPGDEDMEGSETWKGGETGVEITEKMLEQAPGHLNPGGEAVFVGSSLAEIGRLESKFDLERIDSEKLWFEELFLYRFKG